MNKILLDAREMEHPLPLQKSMEHLVEMQVNDYLYMLNNKKPIPLLEIAQGKGFFHFTYLDTQETWHIIISKNSDINLKDLLHV